MAQSGGITKGAVSGSILGFMKIDFTPLKDMVSVGSLTVDWVPWIAPNLLAKLLHQPTKVEQMMVSGQKTNVHIFLCLSAQVVSGKNSGRIIDGICS